MKYLIFLLTFLTIGLLSHAQIENKAQLDEYIDNNINENNQKQITGPKLNMALKGGFNLIFKDFFNKTQADTRFAFKNHTHAFSGIPGLGDTTTALRNEIELLKGGGPAANIGGNLNELLFKDADGAMGNTNLKFDPVRQILTLTNPSLGVPNPIGTPISNRNLFFIGNNHDYHVESNNALIIGYNNVAKISEGAIIGSNNTSNGSPAGFALDNSFVAGEGNNIQWRYSWAIGLYNQPSFEGVAIGTYNQSGIGVGNIGTTHMFGNFLKSKYVNSTLIGIANSEAEIDARIANASSLALAVGVGSHDGDRRTGLIFDKAGNLWLPQMAGVDNEDSLMAFDAQGKIIKVLAAGSSSESPLTFVGPLQRTGNSISIDVVGAGNGVITPLMKTTWDEKQDLITWANATAASNRIAVTGGTGSVKNAMTFDVNEANLSLNNIGGILNDTKGGIGSVSTTSGALKYLRRNSGNTAYELATFPNVISSLVEGDNITIDNTDPANPIISATAAASAVTAFNTRTGDIVPTAGDYNTDLVSEGSTNKYYTDTRARNALSASGALSYNNSTGAFTVATSATGVAGVLSSADRATLFAKENAIAAGNNFQYFRGDKTWQILNTAVVPESGNLYFTDARARLALTASGPGFTYNNSTGAFTWAPPTYSGALSHNTGTNTVTVATSANGVDGILSAADRTTLFAKEPAITAGTSAQYYRGDKTMQTLNTSVVPEGSNQYFTQARARNSISATGTGVTYDANTGVITFTASAGVQSVTAGTNVSITGTATNPIINATGGSGGTEVTTTVAALDACTGCQTVLPFKVTDIGREGLFRYVGTVANQSLDNGGTDIVTADLKHFTRIYNGPILANWFGAVANVNTTQQATANVNAAIAALAVAKDRQLVKFAGGGEWFFNNTITIASTFGNWKAFEIEGDVTFNALVDKAFILKDNFPLYFHVTGTARNNQNAPIDAPTANDSTEYEAYQGTFVYIQNLYHSVIDVYDIERWRTGIEHTGEANGGVGTTANGSQSNTIRFNWIHHNHTQIRISTRGAAGTHGNWSNTGLWYGGQLGRGIPAQTYGQGGWYGIVIGPEPGSSQDVAYGITGHKFHDVSFEGLQHYIKATAATAFDFTDSYWEPEGARYHLNLDPSLSAATRVEGFKFRGGTAFEDRFFVENRRGYNTRFNDVPLYVRTDPDGNPDNSDWAITPAGYKATLIQNSPAITGLTVPTGGLWMFESEGPISTTTTGTTVFDKTHIYRSTLTTRPTVEAGFIRMGTDNRYLAYMGQYRNISTTTGASTDLPPNITANGLIRFANDEATVARLHPGDIIPTSPWHNGFDVEITTTAFPLTIATSDGTTVVASSVFTSGGTGLYKVYYRSGGWFTQKYGGTSSGSSISLGAFSNTGAAAGLTLSGTTLSMNAATVTTPGAINVGAQDISSGKRVLATAASSIFTTETSSSNLAHEAQNNLLSTVASARLSVGRSSVLELGREANQAATVIYGNGRTPGNGRMWSTGMAGTGNNFYIYNENLGSVAMTLFPATSNVRIGTSTTDPTNYKFQVDGNTNLAGNVNITGSLSLPLGNITPLMLVVNPDNTIGAQPIPSGGGGGGSYTFSGGLTESGGNVTNDLITATAVSKSIYGGTNNSHDLTLVSNSSATKSHIFFGSAQTSGFDESTQRLGIGTITPNKPLQVIGDAEFGASNGSNVLGKTTTGSSKMRVEAGTTSGIEMHVQPTNAEIDLGRTGTTGNAIIRYQNSPSAQSTIQWEEGLQNGTSDFILRNAQSATNALRVSLANNNVVIGNAAVGSDKLLVDGTLRANSTIFLAAGTALTPAFRFNPSSNTSLSSPLLGALDFDANNMILHANVNSVTTKQTVITNLNSVDISGDKDWLANPIATTKINGTAGGTGWVLKTTGFAGGASWAPDDGGYQVFQTITTQATGEVIVSIPLPATAGMEVDIILMGKNNSGATMWREHRMIGYATTASAATQKGNTLVSSYTSDFVPTTVTYLTSGLNFNVNVSSVSTEQVNWTAWVFVKQTFTNQ